MSIYVFYLSVEKKLKNKETYNFEFCFLRFLALVPEQVHISGKRKNAMKENQTEAQCCLNCGKPISGRPDKLFCCSRCKNEYHNRISGAERRKRNRVFGILWNNYKILELILDTGSDKAALSSLVEMGFVVNYITGHRRPRGGRDVYSCFDICYNMTEARLYNIRRAPEIAY